MDRKQKMYFYSTAGAMLILSAFCIGLPAVQWWQIANDTILSPFAGAAAVAIGVIKLALFPLAAENQKRGNWLPAGTMFAVALVSFWLSVNATSDLLDNLESKRAQVFAAQSATHKEAKRDLEFINEEINSLNTLIGVDTSENYRKRAYANRPALANLRKEKQNLLAIIQSPQQAGQDSPGWTFAKSVSIDTPIYSAVLEGSTIAAFSLHLICVVALLAITAWWPENAHENKQPPVKKKEKTPETVKGKAKSQPEKTKPETPSELTPAQKRLAEEIVAGEYGDEIAIRKLIIEKAIPGGYPKIKPVFDFLVITNKLRDTGNGYQLTQMTI